jgi:4-diphosphocytidyl-2-C-methyl-D-erythritol kinase
MKIRSFAKINLGIEVLGRRPDLYHEIRTLFQSIDFGDTLELLPRADGEIVLSGTDPAIPWDERNLILRAARLLKRESGVAAGAEIRVEKRIPPGKGLGGGSSNAAMTLHALSKLWGIEPGRAGLQALAASLGADVPYFLEGGLCLGEGRGEVLTPLPDLPPLFGVLVLPPFPSLTADVYARLPLTSLPEDSRISRFLERKDFGLLENRLEETVFNLFPRLETIKSFFYQNEAVLSLVSGSGSAVFGLYRDRERARRALVDWSGPEEALLVETLSRERYWLRMTAGV